MGRSRCNWPWTVPNWSEHWSCSRRPTALDPAVALRSLMTRSMTPEDPTDLLVTLDAEDAFDVRDQLHRISAPTLVIGGAKDNYYPWEMFEQTASGVPDGRTHIFPKWGHVRTCGSSSTFDITLGFFLAALSR